MGLRALDGLAIEVLLCEWKNNAAEGPASTSGDTGDKDWAIGGAVVVLRRCFLLPFGLLSDEKGLGGMLREDRGNVPPSAAVGSDVTVDEVGAIGVLPALEDLRPMRL